MIRKSFIKTNNLISDKMINFIENKNKNDNRKFKLWLNANFISQ